MIHKHIIISHEILTIKIFYRPNSNSKNRPYERIVCLVHYARNFSHIIIADFVLTQEHIYGWIMINSHKPSSKLSGVL